jgi:glycosyltransferase involved in cell wall biosynthesis
MKDFIFHLEHRARQIDFNRDRDPVSLAFRNPGIHRCVFCALLRLNSQESLVVNKTLTTGRTPEDKLMRFSVVTPVLNGRKFLDQTILSVVGQTGPFSIRYHIQDGGSNDGTLDVLAAWQKRLACGFPVGCAGVEFSFESASDRGLYDAVNRGFEVCGDSDAMAWINADDRFEPGAFATVEEIFRNHPDIDWLNGRTTLIDEAGIILLLSPITPFPREAIEAGIFDGRFAGPYFIQQEGTFWRSTLWTKAGGVNANFQLAGDFDLWRRFAKQSELVVVDTILGCFRVRVGQLTTNLARYQAEIDASLSPDEMKIRAKTAKTYAKAGFAYRVLVRPYMKSWQSQSWPMCIAPIFGTNAFGLEHFRLKIMAWLARQSSD